MIDIQASLLNHTLPNFSYHQNININLNLLNICKKFPFLLENEKGFHLFITNNIENTKFKQNNLIVKKVKVD